MWGPFCVAGIYVKTSAKATYKAWGKLFFIFMRPYLLCRRTKAYKKNICSAFIYLLYNAFILIGYAIKITVAGTGYFYLRKTKTKFRSGFFRNSFLAAEQKKMWPSTAS